MTRSSPRSVTKSAGGRRRFLPSQPRIPRGQESNVINQIVAIAERFPNESGIVYCISRDETDSLAQELRNLGYASESYHAGLADDERTKRQEAFINDETRIIVATIAFGMGIDKPNVRFVAHAGMPSRWPTINKNQAEPAATVWKPNVGSSTAPVICSFGSEFSNKPLPTGEL